MNVGAAFTVSATFIQPTPGNNNGRIILVLPGSVLDYTYNWYGVTPSAGNKLLNQFAGTYQVSITSNEGCTVDTFFTLENATSISNLESAEFNISPNPTFDVIKVSWDENVIVKNIRMYDLQGRMLSTQETTADSYSFIDLSTFAKGVYSLQLNTTKGTKSFKVVKLE
jgi:hypothetical protein